MISASVAPLARFIIAMTSAFLLLRSSLLLFAAFAPFCARARFAGLAGAFFEVSLTGATSLACCATSGKTLNRPEG